MIKMIFNQESGQVTIVNKSKYGVLVLIKDNLKLIDDENIYIQIGKSYINVMQKEIEKQK